ncbi:urea amidolyase family protein [Cellulomonas hominis]|uniref:5-oxoprolinase subunit B/C family protein n=1 Tax=Cellulomonas hominis TaxID=156981 RepID=UPI001FED3962|nr:urea amidolyase family protein [Cellulomonas hominis]
MVAYGDDALLVDLPGLDAVRALDDALAARPPAGVVDVVPAARTVLVRFTGAAAAARGARGVAAEAERAAAASGARREEGARPGEAARPREGARRAAGAVVELPVRYDGPDLAEVAALTGLTEAEVVRRHAAATYTVAFGGFMPGFAYLTGLDPALHVPRRATPRERVPAGAVAVAGEYAAVYPAATPGGWRLLGTCDVPLFHVDHDPPALLRPGVRVRFVPVPGGPVPGGPVPGDPADPAPAPATVASAASAASAASPALPPPAGRAVVEVLAPGVLTLVQDAGRPGLAAVGVGRSGAADRGALRLANRLVGNRADAAVLEVLLGGTELTFPAGGVVALAGAEVPAWVGARPVAPHTATRVPPGGALRLGHATRGLRVTVAVRGGVAVPPVLGSRAADQLSGIGPAPLRAGDVLPVGADVQDAAQPWPDPPRAWPAAGEPVVLRVRPGPRLDRFPPGVLDRLCATPWTVTPASNRVAVRLDGPPLPRLDRGELPSEPLVPGAVQVPPDGLPVVSGADHPVTGGYPVPAVVEAASVDAAAQLRPGDAVRFAPAG